MPLIYDLIKGPSYVPVPKAQSIRNAQGDLLPPNDPAFDMAPMAKRTGNGFEIQFTDFTLDGTGNNVFFYYGREIGNRGSLGQGKRRRRVAGVQPFPRAGGEFLRPLQPERQGAHDLIGLELGFTLWHVEKVDRWTLYHFEIQSPSVTP